LVVRVVRMPKVCELYLLGYIPVGRQNKPSRPNHFSGRSVAFSRSEYNIDLFELEQTLKIVQKLTTILNENRTYISTMALQTVSTQKTTRYVIMLIAVNGGPVSLLETAQFDRRLVGSRLPSERCRACGSVLLILRAE